MAPGLEDYSAGFARASRRIGGDGLRRTRGMAGRKGVSPWRKVLRVGLFVSCADVARMYSGCVGANVGRAITSRQEDASQKSELSDGCQASVSGRRCWVLMKRKYALIRRHTLPRPRRPSQDLPNCLGVFRLRLKGLNARTKSILSPAPHEPSPRPQSVLFPTPKTLILLCRRL